LSARVMVPPWTRSVKVSRRMERYMHLAGKQNFPF
jgi:hypothetical protein